MTKVYPGRYEFNINYVYKLLKAARTLIKCYLLHLRNVHSRQIRKLQRHTADSSIEGAEKMKTKNVRDKN
jgi:hypothetical protein